MIWFFILENEMEKKELFEKIVRFLKREKAKSIAIFGSWVRDEERADSDIDILVEFSERKSLLEWVRIERELSEHIGIKVDLLEEGDISPYLIDIINQKKVVIA